MGTNFQTETYILQAAWRFSQIKRLQRFSNHNIGLFFNTNLQLLTNIENVIAKN